MPLTSISVTWRFIYVFPWLCAMWWECENCCLFIEISYVRGIEQQQVFSILRSYFYNFRLIRGLAFLFSGVFWLAQSSLKYASKFSFFFKYSMLSMVWCDQTPPSNVIMQYGYHLKGSDLRIESWGFEIQFSFWKIQFSFS